MLRYVWVTVLFLHILLWPSLQWETHALKCLISIVEILLLLVFSFYSCVGYKLEVEFTSSHSIWYAEINKGGIFDSYILCHLYPGLSKLKVTLQIILLLEKDCSSWVGLFTTQAKSLHVENNASPFLKDKNWGVYIAVEYPDWMH